MLSGINHNLFFHEITHIVFVLPFAIFVYTKTKSVKSVIFLIVTTLLIDLDHLIDYFAYFGFQFNLVDFLDGKQFFVSQRAFEIFHAWEWVIVLGLLTKRKGWESIYAIVFLSLLSHLIVDSIAIANPLFYSITIRAGRGFYY